MICAASRFERYLALNILRPELLAGYERHADDMEVELVGDSGHFIADEKPELVTERARELFAPGGL